MTKSIKNSDIDGSNKKIKLENDDNISIKSEVSKTSLNNSNTNKATEQNEEEEVDDSPDDAIYYIDYILDHKVNDDGSKEYKIRWLNYSDDHDSWSKEKDIFDKDCIEEYWNGLEREKLKKARAHTKSSDPRISLEVETLLDHDPPNIWAKRWADEFKAIDGITKHEDGTLWGYIAWKNGCHTRHPLNEVEDKIPQQLLTYYLNLSFPKN